MFEYIQNQFTKLDYQNDILLLTFKDCCFLSIIDLITLEIFATKICPFLASNFDSLLYFYE